MEYGNSFVAMGIFSFEKGFYMDALSKLVKKPIYGILACIVSLGIIFWCLDRNYGIWQVAAPFVVIVIVVAVFFANIEETFLKVLMFICLGSGLFCFFAKSLGLQEWVPAGLFVFFSAGITGALIYGRGGAVSSTSSDGNAMRSSGTASSYSGGAEAGQDPTPGSHGEGDGAAGAAGAGDGGV